MSKKKVKPIKAPIIQFKDYLKLKGKLKQKLLTVIFYKEKGKHDFSYTMEKHGTKKITDDLAAFGLIRAVEDILEYNGDPCDTLELTQELKIRLGYEVDKDESK